MAVTKIKPIKGTLNKALDYIQNPEKTDGKMLVSSFGCSYETADIEFAFTLSQALDKGSNLAHHLIQAFEPGEVDYQTAHEIGRQLADAVTKGQHEYVLTTHIDKGHIEDFKSYQNLTSLNRRVLVELVESITVYDKEHIHIQYRFDQEIRNVLEYCNSVPTTETEGSTV